MSRPSPRQVYDDPTSAWPYLTQAKDDDVEGQHFDRKEAGRVLVGGTVGKSDIENLQNHIRRTVSAFANSNAEGGLLVLGISAAGEILGIDHLIESQKNALTNLSPLLRNHAAEVAFYSCKDAGENDKTICLIYSGYVPNAICETPEQSPRAWVRSGSQSVLMTEAVRDQTRIRKGVLDADSIPCCPFSSDDVDAEVLKEFRRVFHSETTASLSDERVLYEAGAVVRSNGDFHFTLPGLLFFASNPQRVVPHAYLRLMKFIVPSSEYKNRGTPSFDKDFRGPVTKQIRAARTFLRETSFFERYQHRKADGGFDDQPELPPIAVDEAIVNAVAHRDYHTKTSVECERYSDAFVVKNAGRMLQRNVDLPDQFSLAHTSLDSMPRNRKLLEWLRLMQDPDGKAFVQAISEGTKRMAREMVTLGLPPPTYILSENETLVRLESNAERRKAAFLASIQVAKTAFTNIYPLALAKGGTPISGEQVHAKFGDCGAAIRDSLSQSGWYVDRSSFSRLVVHRTGIELSVPQDVRRIVRMYPAYSMQVHELRGRLFLSIDYTCQVLNVLRANEVLESLGAEPLVNRRCVAHAPDWREGRITRIDEEWASVLFGNDDKAQSVLANHVIPQLSLDQIEGLLRLRDIDFDLRAAIRKNSLVSEPAAARRRSERIDLTAKQIAKEAFPVHVGELELRLESNPVTLSEFEEKAGGIFRVQLLSEPAVEFRDHHKLADVREGITTFGSFDTDPHAIELIPVCLSANRNQVEALIERLKAGRYKYRGAERTFSTRFSYATIVTVESVEQIDREIARLLSEHPEWLGDEKLSRLFLVQTPEANFASDDESAPYFTVKRRLLEAGIPCQMVDTPTLINPDWKDLNLSLNIIAKCGVVPWVLPETIPDADFFVGLSYTQSRDGQRIVGFANIFNSYGKWEFYTGNTAAFDVRDRGEHLSILVRLALERLKREHSLPAGPTLVFHHSLRISKEDYSAIISTVRTIAPEASVIFVWINGHSNFRLFDSRAETDGSIARGSYVQVSKRRVLLSTTGHNVCRKALGTPRPLEITGDRYGPHVNQPGPCEPRTLALQVLSLTKLNWASTDSFSSEPITTKYAGDIAYLTAAFLRQREPFQLHSVLERTPWFI